MAIFADEKGNIYLRQGDTGNVTFSGLPKDKNYGVYISVYNPDNENILKETQATSFVQATGVALFTFDEDFSNDLPVGDWTYGLKICAGGSEDTVLPRTYINDSNEIIKEAPLNFVVDYKYVEGT